MTAITFYKKQNHFTGFEIKGHTGKDDYGKDLLCCEISTLAQFAVMAIQEIEKAPAFVEISDGYLKLKLKEKTSQSEKISFLLNSCYAAFQSILEGESKFAKLEVKNDV